MNSLCFTFPEMVCFSLKDGGGFLFCMKISSFCLRVVFIYLYIFIYFCFFISIWNYVAMYIAYIYIYVRFQRTHEDYTVEIVKDVPYLKPCTEEDLLPHRRLSAQRQSHFPIDVWCAAWLERAFWMELCPDLTLLNLGGQRPICLNMTMTYNQLQSQPHLIFLGSWVVCFTFLIPYNDL